MRHACQYNIEESVRRKIGSFYWPNEEIIEIDGVHPTFNDPDRGKIVIDSLYEYRGEYFGIGQDINKAESIIKDVHDKGELYIKSSSMDRAAYTAAFLSQILRGHQNLDYIGPDLKDEGYGRVNVENLEKHLDFDQEQEGTTILVTHLPVIQKILGDISVRNCGLFLLEKNPEGYRGKKLY